MIHPHTTSLKRRLLIAGVGLLSIVLVAVGALLVLSRQHSHYLLRSAQAQLVYSSYLAVSDHTYRKLSSMAQIVDDGNYDDIQERYRNQKALRAALAAVRDNLIVNTGDPDAHQTAALELYNDISDIADDIILGSEAVRLAIDNRDRVGARAALDALRSDDVEGTFNRLIDEAIAAELVEVRETQRVASELVDLFNRAVAVLLPLLLLLLIALIYNTWRALTRSLTVFETAVSGYREGAFEHRIQSVDEAEFAELADALNSMAAEIEAQRERERRSQADLEEQVRTRTQALEQSNGQLEAVSETRRQFLADISHELRTPLTIIQGEVDVALRGGEKATADYVDALTRVREQTVHTTRLVQDLLFIARTEGGRSPIHRRADDMAPLVRQACEDLRPLAAERDISIVERFNDEALPVEIDTGRMKQVVTILIDNAIKYSNRGSSVDVSLAVQGADVVLHVIDDGIGIEFNQSNQVFSRFYRGHDALEKSTGTGLGLPVAKAIVDAHGGSVSLTPESGRGTRATVRIPLKPGLKAVS